MAVPRKAMTEGIRIPIFLCALMDAVLQSLSQLRCQLPLHKGAGHGFAMTDKGEAPLCARKPFWKKSGRPSAAHATI